MDTLKKPGNAPSTATDTTGQKLQCSVCGKPTLRLIDGEPCCDEHASLVYENQFEDFTAHDMGLGHK